MVARGRWTDRSSIKKTYVAGQCSRVVDTRSMDAIASRLVPLYHLNHPPTLTGRLARDNVQNLRYLVLCPCFDRPRTATVAGSFESIGIRSARSSSSSPKCSERSKPTHASETNFAMTPVLVHYTVDRSVMRM